MSLFSHALHGLMLAGLLCVGGGAALAWGLRECNLRWTWALAGFPAGLLLSGSAPVLALGLWVGAGVACRLGARWQRVELLHGADLGQAAAERLGVTDALRRAHETWRAEHEGPLRGGWLVLGRDRRGLAVSIPAGGISGSHTLVLGATGSGKTVSEAWVSGRLIEAGRAAIVLDPKGDAMLRGELRAAAARRGAPFLEWSPQGPAAYNPYARGTPSEIADKALAGEVFTEPHYLRQAQRYLGHAVRVMHAAGIAVTPASLACHMDPARLEISARTLSRRGDRDDSGSGGEQGGGDAGAVKRYLAGLSDRQRSDLAGIRDRLAILAESDVARWLDPEDVEQVIDLGEAIEQRAVVYVRLDADRRPLLAQMLGAALVTDLVTLVARGQQQPVPAVVVIDEFSALGARHVARLFARARSAGVSLILGTQELADLDAVGEGLREQVLGNVAAIVAHRQNVPASAELLAQIAGSRGAWVTRQQTAERRLLGGDRASGRASRSRGYAPRLAPEQIKELGVGEAAVITPGSGRPPRIARVEHP